MATVVKLVPRKAWDGGAILIEQMTQAGVFGWKVGPQAEGVVCGLSRRANNGAYSFQSHSWSFSGGLATVMELGVARTGPFPFTPEDWFGILVSGGKVFYVHQPDGQTEPIARYTSTVPAPAFPQVLDCAMYAPGDMVRDADFVPLAELEDPANGPGPSAIPGVGATAANTWTIIGWGAEIPTGSTVAANTWRIVQPQFTDTVDPDRVVNQFLPFVGFGVDGEAGTFANNRLPFFTNRFSYEERPETVSMANQWWIDDLLDPAYDYAPTMADKLHPFVGFGSQVVGAFFRNKIHPFVGWGLELAPESVYFNLRLPTLRGFKKELGVDGGGGQARFALRAWGYGRQTGLPSTGTAIYPTLVARGGGAGSGAALYPTLVARGSGIVVSGGVGSAIYPTLVAYGEGVSGGVGDGAAVYPTLVARGSGVGPSTGRAVFPTLRAWGSGVGGGIGVGRALYPTLRAYGTGVGGGIGKGRAVFPTLRAYGTSGSSGRALYPMLVAYGEGVGDDLANATTAPGWPKAYLVNITTGALTAMPSLDGLVALYAAHGTLYGRKADGTLVAFDVPATLATPVYFHIRTASDLLDEPGQRHIKRLDTLYLVMREPAGLLVSIVADETEFWPHETETDTSPGLGPHKIKIGRGIRFTEVAFDLRVKTGEAVSLGEILPLVAPHSRRPK